MFVRARAQTDFHATRSNPCKSAMTLLIRLAADHSAIREHQDLLF